MEITKFKDLPKEEQVCGLEKLKSGEQVYGLSPDDDTHVKFAVMTVLDRLKELQSDQYNITFFVEIGYDEKGLFVSYPINEITTDDNTI